MKQSVCLRFVYKLIVYYMYILYIITSNGSVGVAQQSAILAKPDYLQFIELNFLMLNNLCIRYYYVVMKRVYCNTDTNEM